MDYFKVYFITNFIFLAVSLIMLVFAIAGFKRHKRISACIIALVVVTLLLTIEETMQEYTKELGNALATSILAFYGYVMSPGCAVLFVLLSGEEPKKWWFWIFMIPFFANLIIFSLMFVPSLAEHVALFVPSKNDQSVYFTGGPLRYSSHIVAGLYLAYLLYASFKKIRLKHFINAIAIIICFVLVVSAVIVETFFNANGEVRLLNTSIAVSVMIYYLFLYIERGKYDPLTKLFNREAYYQDLDRMEKSATAVIQFDMNGLKYLNDNFGHQKGDEGLVTIARIIAKRCVGRMYAYRLGGDEFIAIANKSDESTVNRVVARIKEDLRDTGYSCSIGVAFRTDRNESLDSLFKRAEKEMYQAKEAFYKTAEFERRKV